MTLSALKQQIMKYKFMLVHSQFLGTSHRFISDWLCVLNLYPKYTPRGRCHYCGFVHGFQLFSLKRRSRLFKEYNAELEQLKRHFAITCFAEGLKKQFKKETIVWRKDPDTGEEMPEEEAKIMCIALNSIAPKIVDMFLKDYLKENYDIKRNKTTDTKRV